MKHREKTLAAVALLSAIALAFLAHRLQADPFWLAITANLAATLVGVAIALVLMDIYLDTSRRRDAVRPLLRLVQPSIRKHHNKLMDDAAVRFGRPQFMELIKRYKDSGGDPLSLTPEERSTLYALVQEQRDTLFPTLDELDKDLKELVQILGWAFNPQILRDSFACRFAIAQLKRATFDGSDEDVSLVVEHFLDTDLMGFQVHDLLVNTLGISKSDVYAQR